jgi:hypothetical protein
MLAMGLLDTVALVPLPLGADVKTGVPEGTWVIEGEPVWDGLLLGMGLLLSIRILGTSVKIVLTEGTGEIDGVTEPVAFGDPVITGLDEYPGAGDCVPGSMAFGDSTGDALSGDALGCTIGLALDCPLFGELEEGATVGTVVGAIVGNDIGTPTGEAVEPSFALGAAAKGLGVFSSSLPVGAWVEGIVSDVGGGVVIDVVGVSTGAEVPGGGAIGLGLVGGDVVTTGIGAVVVMVGVSMGLPVVVVGVVGRTAGAPRIPDDGKSVIGRVGALDWGDGEGGGVLSLASGFAVVGRAVAPGVTCSVGTTIGWFDKCTGPLGYDPSLPFDLLFDFFPFDLLPPLPPFDFPPFPFDVCPPFPFDVCPPFPLFPPLVWRGVVVSLGVLAISPRIWLRSAWNELVLIRLALQLPRLYGILLSGVDFDGFPFAILLTRLTDESYELDARFSADNFSAAVSFVSLILSFRNVSW